MYIYIYFVFHYQVVESPCDSALIPDGAALSAYQYFENVRNFLVAVQEMGLPTFEASDLEQVGAVVKEKAKNLNTAIMILEMLLRIGG